jgi:hypothetical protein
MYAVDTTNATDFRKPPVSSGSRRELGAVLVASGKTYKDAAAQIGVSERTVRAWAKSPEFAVRVKEIRADLIGTAAGRLAGVMGAAVEVLETLLTSTDESIKFRAAKAIVECAVRIQDAAENAERLNALESILLAKAAQS